MWLMTRFGFFSVVQKGGETDLTIRSRVRTDLEELHSRYIPAMSEILEVAGSDYKYRVKISHIDFAEAMRQLIMDVDYSNFKNTVLAEQGVERAQVYDQIWHTLFDLKNTSV